jgi:hypothetical protein
VGVVATVVVNVVLLFAGVASFSALAMVPMLTKA